nr:hypothetical protein HmN_000207200 [Hymenolepis microstoma]
MQVHIQGGEWCMCLCSAPLVCYEARVRVRMRFDSDSARVIHRNRVLLTDFGMKPLEKGEQHCTCKGLSLMSEHSVEESICQNAKVKLRLEEDVTGLDKSGAPIGGVASQLGEKHHKRENDVEVSGEEDGKIDDVVFYCATNKDSDLNQHAGGQSKGYLYQDEIFKYLSDALSSSRTRRSESPYTMCAFTADHKSSQLALNTLKPLEEESVQLSDSTVLNGSSDPTLPTSISLATRCLNASDDVATNLCIPGISITRLIFSPSGATRHTRDVTLHCSHSEDSSSHSTRNPLLTSSSISS